LSATAGALAAVLPPQEKSQADDGYRARQPTGENHAQRVERKGLADS
jgi:hypothetical protein